MGATPKKKREKGWLVLSRTLGKAHSGYVAATGERPFSKDYVGKKGVAATDLRPAGKAMIDGEVLDVVSNLGYVDQGASVEVTAVEGVRIVVTEVK